MAAAQTALADNHHAMAAAARGARSGILAWLSNKNVAAAVLTGGASFVAAATLVVLVLNLLCRGH